MLFWAGYGILLWFPQSCGGQKDSIPENTPRFSSFFFLGSLHSHVPKDSPLIQGLGAQVSGSQDPAPINILFLKEQILSRTPWMVPVAFEVFFVFDFFFFFFLIFTVTLVPCWKARP